MGNNLEKEKNEQISKLKFEVVQSQEFDPRFGHVQLNKILKNTQFNSLALLKEFTFQNEVDAQKIIDKIKLRQNLQSCPYFMPIIKYKFQQLNDLCSSIYKLELYQHFSQITLENEIQDRAKEFEYFTEQDLLFLLKCICTCLTFLNENKINHGNVQPINIFINLNDPLNRENQKYLFQLHDIQFLSQSDIFYQFLQDQQQKQMLQKYYVSNEFLTMLNVAQDNYSESFIQSRQFSTLKNDVFSLGMVLLHAGTLESVQQCYDFQSNCIIRSQIDRLLEILHLRYPSGLLYEIVQQMLSYDPSLRPSPSEIVGKLLKSYSDQYYFIPFAKDVSEKQNKDIQQETNNTNEKQQIFSKFKISKELKLQISQHEEIFHQQKSLMMNENLLKQKFQFVIEQAERAKERFKHRKVLNNQEEEKELEKIQSIYQQSSKSNQSMINLGLNLPISASQKLEQSTIQQENQETLKSKNSSLVDSNKFMQLYLDEYSNMLESQNKNKQLDSVPEKLFQY